MNRLLAILFFSSLTLCTCISSEHNDKEITQKTFNQLFTSLDLSNNQTYVINFWATWCSPCIKELPHFEYVNKKYDNNIVKVFLVSLDLPEHYNSKLIPFINFEPLTSSLATTLFVRDII